MSSYQGPFAQLSPSDRADIASFSEPAEAVCELCGEPMDPEDISVEAFEMSGCLACSECLEGLAEQETHQ